MKEFIEVLSDVKIVCWKLSQLSEYLREFVLAQREHTLKLNQIKSMFQKHQIGGPYIWKYRISLELSYTRYRSELSDRLV